MTDEPELRSVADLIKACFAAHREATEFCAALGDTDAATVDFLALKILKRRWRPPPPDEITGIPRPKPGSGVH